MGKIKKYAKGGSYYVEVKDSPKAPTPVKPAKPVDNTGWSFDHAQIPKK
jgi:hypothetical protein